MIRKISAFSALGATVWGMGASAQEAVGIAKPWQLGFQDAASPVMERLSNLHNGLLLYTIVGICIFVIALTFYIAIRFNRRANPVASKTTHNMLLEIVWTIIPVLILVAIFIPSIRAHYFMERSPEADLTLKVTGRQWYWSYEYPDFGNFGYDSYMVKDEDLKPGQHRLLEVDNRVVVPVNAVVRVQMTGADVIHAWAVPALGVKRDAVPGRLNETWFQATKEGVFYGQCSELCGVGHGFMPIAVEVVSREAFDTWVRGKQKEAGVPVIGAVKSQGPASSALPTEAAVPPQSVQEPAPGDNAPQAPENVKPAQTAPVGDAHPATPSNKEQ